MSLRYRLSSPKGEIHKRGNRRDHMLAQASILSAAPSYACFSFLRFLFQVKRKRKKTNNRITFPNPLQSPKARFDISRHRVRQDLVADISVPNSPSVTASRAPSRCGSVTRGSDSPPGCHSLPLARLRLRLAYPLHGAGKRAYRFYMHYQRNSILFCLSGYDFALLTHCTSTILRFCKAEFHI